MADADGPEEECTTRRYNKSMDNVPGIGMEAEFIFRLDDLKPQFLPHIVDQTPPAG